MTLGTFQDLGTMSLADRPFRRMPGTDTNGTSVQAYNAHNGGTSNHPVQCSEVTDCGSCNLAWPQCAWCASSGGCMAVTEELKTTAEYKWRNTKSKEAVHVIYNVGEYQRSWGMSAGIDPSETVFGNQCLVWIVNASSCSHIQNYCSDLDSCNPCLRRSGCGWCQNAEHSYNGGDSNICMPGTQSGELTMVQQTSCAQIGGKWVFGSWSKFREEDKWMYRCPGSAEVAPGGHGSNFLAPPPSRNEYEAKGGLNDQIGVAVSIFIGLVSIFILLVLIIFWITKFRHSGEITAATRRRGVLSAAADPNVRAGVDIEALEKEMPSCRPKIIGYKECEDVADETKSESSVESARACAVCLANLEEGDEARSLPCGHIFHRECIDSWLFKSHQCPVCRRLVAQVAVDPTASRLDGTPEVIPPAAESAEPGAEPVVAALDTDSVEPVVTAQVEIHLDGDADVYMEREI